MRVELMSADRRGRRYVDVEGKAMDFLSLYVQGPDKTTKHGRANRCSPSTASMHHLQCTMLIGTCELHLLRAQAKRRIWICKYLDIHLRCGHAQSLTLSQGVPQVLVG